MAALGEAAELGVAATWLNNAGWEGRESNGSRHAASEGKGGIIRDGWVPGMEGVTIW